MDDDILKLRRKAPDAPNYLVSNIVLKSRRISQIVANCQIKDVNKMFLLPNPAVALAACLLIGISMGIFMPEADNYNIENEWDSYFYIEAEDYDS